MDTLKTFNVAQLASQLTQPFEMLNIAFVDDLIVSLYVCQGRLDWHRHPDNDELFWVCEGSIWLESEWGDIRLAAGEVALVPKGIGHRSRSVKRAIVLLWRCAIVPERKNGKRRLYGVLNDEMLNRVSLSARAEAIDPFVFQTVARVEDAVLQVARGEGTWPVDIPAAVDVCYFVLRGEARITVDQSVATVRAGEFTTVPREAIYRLSTNRETMLARVMREEK